MVRLTLHAQVCKSVALAVVQPSCHSSYPAMPRVLFVCSQNKLRSPTAEVVFAEWPGVECASAGTNRGADNLLTPDLVEWAEIIFVMEKQHQRKLAAQFQRQLKHARVICLGIPDQYDFMQPELVALLKRKVAPHLR